jgi:hypothetical protein
MVNNFGGNNRRRPFLGTVFETEEAVRAAEAGEVLFTHDPERNASKLPSPLGAWIGVDHGDGLISIYGRLSKDRDVPLPRRVSKGERIAAPGQSGWSGHRGFYFSLFDRKERRWINPSMIITPLPDSRQPNILSVELKNANGQTISPGQTSSIRQGRYTLLVNAFDTRFSERENPLAPYRILCFVNGIETAGLSFETYSARDGVLMVYRNGLTPVNKIYAPGPAFEVGELWLTRGLASLEVIAQDVAGNSRSAAFRLQVE